MVMGLFRSGIACLIWSIGRGYMKKIKQFIQDELAQDIIEYGLLLAFVALASAALFVGTGQSVKGIWTTANSTLVQGAGCDDRDNSRPCND
jgi:Flp pilus assembly pilin Flp